jgi:MoaA/NifB/PqqE/SkfB family radical SAM enzyme
MELIDKKFKIVKTASLDKFELENINPKDIPDMTCNSTKGSIHISDRGHLKPCCYFQNYGPHEKYWYEDSHIFNINSLDDRVDSYEWNNFVSPNPHCGNCIKEEMNGIHSLRQHWNETIAPDTNKLQHLELALDFTCNMMCRMCNPSQSSVWNASPVLKTMKDEIGVTDWNDETYVKTKGSKDYTTNLKRILSNSDLSELKKVVLIGGEPLYSKSLPWFINLLKKQEHWKDIELHIITNGSILPSEDLFAGFKRLKFDVSIDAVGDLATVSRMKVPWKIIDENIRRMVKLYDVHFHTTVSLLNCNYLQPLLDYREHLGIDWYSHTFAMLHNPRHLLLDLIPEEYRQKWITTMSKDTRIHPKIKTMLKTTHQENPDEAKRFLRAIEILDAESEIPYRDVNPEIVEIMEELVKNYKSDNKI